MTTTKEELQRAECCGYGCTRIWSCNATPPETPCVVLCCYPCSVGMQWETIRAINYSADNRLCPSSFEGCACCMISLCVTPAISFPLQGYISANLASDAREVTCGNCIKYTCWDCFSLCTCGTCITMEAAYSARNSVAGTNENMKTLM